MILTEFVDIGFGVDAGSGWGYTMAFSEQDYLSDYSRVIDAVYASKVLHCFCYMQLTDVEQEINGLLTYDCKPKADLAEIKKMNSGIRLR